jgi:hypothetical protein
MTSQTASPTLNAIAANVATFTIAANATERDPHPSYPTPPAHFPRRNRRPTVRSSWSRAPSRPIRRSATSGS